MKIENVNVVVTQDAIEHLSLEGEGGTQCRVRGKVNKVGLICTPSSVLRTSSPSMGKGFTLIELLVVVLIIGILAAVAVPQYQKAVAKTRVVEAITNLKAITDAQELYYLANGEYSNEITNLDVSVDISDATNWTYSCNIGINNYCIALSKRREDPKIEFHLNNIPSKYQERFASRIGKHWCHYNSQEKDENILQKQHNICKTFGPEDDSLGWPNYYIIR